MTSGAKPARRLRVPHVFTITLTLLVLTALAGLVVPAGSFQRADDGRVLPGTFVFDATAAGTEAPPRPHGAALAFSVFTAPLRGFKDAAEIIAFILVIGGAFKVVERSGAFIAAIHATVELLTRRHLDFLVIPVAMTLFSVGGSVFGMSEEIIPFIFVFVPLAQALGYPRIIGVAIPLIGAGVGFSGAVINPFTVGIAQALAGLPPLSGWQYRVIIWLAVTATGISFVMLGARRLRGTPPDEEDRAADLAEAGDRIEPQRFTRTHAAVLSTLAVAIVAILAGVSLSQWYVTEIGAVFLAMGIAAGLIARLGQAAIARAFIDGAAELVSAGLVVGLSRGVVLLAQELRVMDTVLYAMAESLKELPGAISINAMFIFQTIIHVLVPSGSGQAALTIPIMAPLAELIGQTRQMAVLVFQFGDGFGNMIIPTSATLMGCLAAGKVSYEKWFRWAWPLQLWLLLFGFLFLTIAYLIGYGP